MAYSRTLPKKRKLSNRKGPRRLESTFDTLGTSSCSFPNGKSHVVNSLVGYQTATQVVNSANTFRIVTPSNKDFRPFLWRFPKTYTRSFLKTEAVSVKTVGVAPVNLLPFATNTVGPFMPPSHKTVWAVTYVDSIDKNRHFLNFNEKLADQKVDVLTTVAEAKSTVTMIANAAESLFNLYRAIRKADTQKVKRLLKARNIKKSLSKGWRNKTAESRWLELQYGWLPLVGDIRTLLEEMAADHRPPAPIIKVVHSTKLHKERYITDDRIRTLDFFGIYKTSCYYTVKSQDIRNAAKWNLGNNPLLTAWELVPYSFVIDWFLPIGDFLTQFSSSDGLEFISGTSAFYMKYKAERDYSQNFRSNPYISIATSTSQQSFYITRREVHTKSPIGLPVFEQGLSTKRALNALALISQRRK